MMLRANQKNLKAHAKELLGNEHSEESERALIKEALQGFSRDNYCHISHDRADHLDRLGKILHTCGTEGILEEELDIQYCNAGDTYALTLLYWKGALHIGSWGDAVELSEQEQS